MLKKLQISSKILAPMLLIALLATSAMAHGRWHTPPPPPPPRPTITSFSPTTAVAGDPDTAFTVNGTNFPADATIYFGHTALTTTVVSAIQLTATIPAASLAAVGNVRISVESLTTRGGSSQTPFTISPITPLPTITTLDPATVVAGGPDLTLTVTGTGFLSTSVVLLNHHALVTTFVSDTQVTAVVPAAGTHRPGRLSVTVSNGPTGGYSNRSTLSVTPAPVQVYYFLAPAGQTGNDAVGLKYLIPAASAPDFTQPLSLTLANPATTDSMGNTIPAVQVWGTAAPVTLTAQTYTDRKGNVITYYTDDSTGVEIVIFPTPSGDFELEAFADGLDLSAISATTPVLATVTLGTLTLTSTVQPTTW